MRRTLWVIQTILGFIRAICFCLFIKFNLMQLIFNIFIFNSNFLEIWPTETALHSRKPGKPDFTKKNISRTKALIAKL